MIKCALIVRLGSIGRRHLRILRELYPDLDIRILRLAGCAEKQIIQNRCSGNIEAACRFNPDFPTIDPPATENILAAKALAHANMNFEPRFQFRRGFQKFLTPRDESPSQDSVP